MSLVSVVKWLSIPCNVLKWWVLNIGKSVKGSNNSNTVGIKRPGVSVRSRMIPSARRHMHKTPADGESKEPLSFAAMRVAGRMAELRASAHIVHRRFSCKFLAMYPAMYSTTSSTNLVKLLSEKMSALLMLSSDECDESKSSVPSCGRTLPFNDGRTPHRNKMALNAAAKVVAVGFGFQPPVGNIFQI